MLHGYDNGHRLLASSVLLKNSTEMSSIAMLSDWSEYLGSSNSDSSYLTAYSLEDSGYYVIAKTWYAVEMMRPGCVWTHSLLIPFEELNGIDDFARLLPLFVRPDSESSFDKYSSPYLYENLSIPLEGYKELPVDRETASIILRTVLFGHESSVYFRSTDNQIVNLMMLSIMNFLPKDFIEVFSWCTGTASPRLFNGQPLLCQFLSGSPIQNRLMYNVEEPWMTYVLNALLRGDINKGQLIRLFAEDISNSVENYTAIIQVLYTFEDYFSSGKDGSERFKEILIIISKFFPKADDGPVLKALCSKKSFSDKYCVEEKFFLYFATLPLDGVFDLSATKFNARWEHFIQANRTEYLSLLNEIVSACEVNGWGRMVLQSSADILNGEEVTTIVRNNLHLFSAIVYLNPLLLNKVELEKLSANEVKPLLRFFMNEHTQAGFTQWNSLFKHLLYDGIKVDKSLATKIFESSRKAISLLFDFVNSDVNRNVDIEMLGLLYDYSTDIMDWLESVKMITDNVAKIIANVIDEHSSVVAYRGPIVWIPLVEVLSHNITADIYAFAFSLSFNWPNNSVSLELMRKSFYYLHEAQSEGVLDLNSWTRISSYLEPLCFWENWDECKKIRKAVIKRLKRANADISVLAHYTPDNALNEQLRNMW